MGQVTTLPKHQNVKNERKVYSKY